MIVYCSCVMSKVQENTYVSAKQSAIPVTSAWWMRHCRSTEEKDKAVTQELGAPLRGQREKTERGSEWPSTVSQKARAWS